MSKYRVHRLKESARQQFRWAPHTIGMTVAKPKDYESVFEGESASPYSLWEELKGTEHELALGDILESDSGDLRIYKYVGFEEAQWQLPEVKTNPETSPSPAAQPTETLSNG